MKIIGVAIENFGKLRDFTWDFSQGVQVFCEPNGWGKSTLAAFLRVMFFGFSGEKKRDDLSNERKRYEPWQKGTYGGSVIFEIGGTEYEMVRVFGRKESEDEFCLYRQDTHLKSYDYSSNIGEELFQIDRESFSRTIYIEQQDCVTYATDGIHAKIGNLIELSDDVNNYENAYARLKEKANSMRPHHKKGMLWQLQEKIGELEGKLLQGQSWKEQARQNFLQKEKYSKEKVQLEKQLKELEEKQLAGGVLETDSRKYTKTSLWLIVLGMIGLVLGGLSLPFYLLPGGGIVTAGVISLFIGIRFRFPQEDGLNKENDEISREELGHKMQHLKKKWMEVQEQIFHCEQCEQEDWERQKKVDHWRKELANLKSSYEKGLCEYTLVCRTMELLQQAKEQLATKYMGPMQKEFYKYYGMFYPKRVENYRFDAEFNLTIDEEGMQRQLRFMSEGHKDLAGICTRVAMADAMYQGEKPFLIFDDPFVNLDEETMEKAKGLLDKISKNYQVIYFTCHKSRAL